MASTKPNTGSGAESTGGFKTVAFGFDKNDVNMYIAGLRKKMKNMEEEFEQKLAQALDNPTASNDALKHEREVIRAETEKIWGEKLNERNNILKQQQSRINELEEELKVSKEKVASLRTQLAAATSDSNSDAVVSARAAKAYMQFTRELRNISSSVEKTLVEMEQRWKGELGEAIKEVQEKEAPSMSSADTAKAAAAAKNKSDILVADISDNSISAEDTAGAEVQPVSVTENTAAAPDIGIEIDDSLLAEPLPKEPEAVPAKPEKTANASKAAKKKAEPVPQPIIEDIDPELLAEEPKPQPQPALKPEIDSDLGSLLMDDSPSEDDLTFTSQAPAEKAKKAPAAPKMDIDDDLSALLADDISDFLVAPSDNTVGADDDFEKLLAEPEKKIDRGEDLVFSDGEPKIVKGDDLNADLLSNIVINPDENIGDLGEMIQEKENAELEEFQDLFVTAADDGSRNDGLGIEVGNIDFGMESADELTEKAKEAANNTKKEEDLFDFSFLAADPDDEEDDMSTDVSFSGML